MSLRTAIKLYQDRGSRIVTNPETEPVSLLELKRYLRIDDNSDDVFLADQLMEARRYIEEQIGLAFLTQSWRLAIDQWPAGGEAWWDGVREMSISELYRTGVIQTLTLPRWPLQSITSVTVYDEDSTATSINVANTFDVDVYQTPGRMTLKRGQTWPVALRANNAIEIVYVAGYTSASTVPITMKRAVRQLAGFMYSHRGDDCTASDAYQESGAANIMAQYRAMKI
jgi:uncharacterized phiE125 gp8 family phage protein